MAIDDNTSYELTGYQVKDLASKVRAKADSSSLASVATSGLYSDLTGAPTIPTVYNGTLTIQHNGTTKGTFTANQSSASTVNIETIYADDYISTSPIPTTVTTAMIEDGAVTTAKIDDGAVTTAKIDDGAVTAAKTAFGGNYSTTEVNTGFTWIDGKPIYKKTINFGNLPNNSAKRVAHGVSGLLQLVKIDTIMNRSGANAGFYPLPFVSKSTANDQIEISVNDTNVSIGTNIDWSSCTAYATIYYTKTTD